MRVIGVPHDKPDLFFYDLNSPGHLIRIKEYTYILTFHYFTWNYSVFFKAVFQIGQNILCFYTNI